MTTAQLISILMDVALGGMAYRLARSLERAVAQQAAILSELTRRVERLEEKKE